MMVRLFLNISQVILHGRVVACSTVCMLENQKMQHMIPEHPPRLGILHCMFAAHSCICTYSTCDFHVVPLLALCSVILIHACSCNPCPELSRRLGILILKQFFIRCWGLCLPAVSWWERQPNMMWSLEDQLQVALTPACGHRGPRVLWGCPRRRHLYC